MRNATRFVGALLVLGSCAVAVVLMSGCASQKPKALHDMTLEELMELTIDVCITPMDSDRSANKPECLAPGANL